MSSFNKILAVTPIQIRIEGCPCCGRIHLDDMDEFTRSQEDFRLFYCDMEGKPYVIIHESFTGSINFTLNGIRPQRVYELAFSGK